MAAGKLAFSLPQISLRAAIMTGATVAVVVFGIAFSAIAYSQLSRVTLGAAENWSISVAKLVSSSNTSALILNDIAAMESNLQQIAKLPGIEEVSIFRADGRQLVQASWSGDQVVSSVGGDARLPLTLEGVNSIEGTLNDSFYEAWAPISTGRAFPSAWVRVHFSLAQRSEDLKRLQIGAGALIAALLAVLMTSLNWIIVRTIAPIRALSLFASEIPLQAGKQIAVSHNFKEVDQLGAALNQASREIAEQVGRTRAIVNTASEAIIGLDESGLISTVNPVADSFFGQSGVLALLHSPIVSFIPGLTAKALYEMFEDPDSYYHGMERIIRRDLMGARADGTPFPVEISMGKVSGIKGLRYVCIVRDVTDERAALEFTELYERALACSHNAVFITNAKLPDQPIVYVNDALQALLDRKLHEALGRKVESILNINANDPSLVEMRSALAEKRHANLKLNMVDLHATDRTVELSLSPVMSDKGEITQMIGIVSDVTERVRTEVINEKRRAQLDAIFSLSPDGFVLFDAKDRLVFANPAFQRMFGMTHNEQSAPMDLLEFERFMAYACSQDALAQALQFNSTESADFQEWQARLNVVRPQTRVVQAQARKNTVGRSETIFYFRDITHEDAVDRMKSEFLAAAAHELRTPMVSIFGFTELLLRRKFTPERQADMLDTIHRQSGLLVKMINELLDLARIESRRGLDLQIEPAPLVEMLHNSVKGLMLKDTERQVLVGELPEAMVMIDKEKIQLAMNNLLSNAFKYSPKGGEVHLNARLDTLDHKPYVVIEISDQGIGMTPEQLSRAFERFYRADASGNIPGTGLGLSMVKEVANLHNGQIELDSVMGSGTTARLWLPLDTRAQA